MAWAGTTGMAQAGALAGTQVGDGMPDGAGTTGTAEAGVLAGAGVGTTGTTLTTMVAGDGTTGTTLTTTMPDVTEITLTTIILGAEATIIMETGIMQAEEQHLTRTEEELQV